MSRIDDDREAQRVQERLLLKQQKEAQRAQERAQSESAFARKIQENQASARSAQKDKQASLTEAERHVGEDVQEHTLDELLLEAETHTEHADDEARAREGGKAFQKRMRTGAEVGRERRGEGQAFEGRQVRAAQASQAGTEGRSQGRHEDAGAARDKLQHRGEALKRGQAQAQDAAASAADESRTDADAGGKGGKDSGGDGKDSGGQMAQGFRLNPALLAPPPVAQPKDGGASARLRALANEIAQKIVERVRIGTNAAGMAEFQIDLKSNVLSGLSIKVSGSKGRIRAVFSGRDREVLQLLKEQANGLKAALEGRGLRLEELKIESTA